MAFPLLAAIGAATSIASLFGKKSSGNTTTTTQQVPAPQAVLGSTMSPYYRQFLQDVLLPRAGVSSNMSPESQTKLNEAQSELQGWYRALEGATGDEHRRAVLANISRLEGQINTLMSSGGGFQLQEGYLSPARKQLLGQGQQLISQQTARSARSAARPYDLAGQPGMGLAAKQQAEQTGLRNRLGFQTEQALAGEAEQTARLQEAFNAISTGMGLGSGGGTQTTTQPGTNTTWSDLGALAAGYIDLQSQKELAKLIGQAGIGSGSYQTPVTLNPSGAVYSRPTLSQAWGLSPQLGYRPY